MDFRLFGRIILVIFFIYFGLGINAKNLVKNSDKIREEIQHYRGVANEIINYVTKGAAKHQVYNRLAKFVDTFGPRLAGSQNLENSIDYMLKVLKADGLENVHGEDVTVPHWVRGKEFAKMIEPRNHTLNMLGLGGSVGTPQEGITAEVIVVKSFDELHQRADEVRNVFLRRSILLLHTAGCYCNSILKTKKL